MINKKNIRILRYIIQGIGVLLTIFGIFTNFPISKTILLGITFMMGPVFCGWICPLGTLQDAFSWLGNKLKIKKKVMPGKIQKMLVILRYIFFAVGLLISADFIFTLFSYDPQSNLNSFLTGNSISFLGWIIILIFAIISIVYERPFCNYLCVQGAEYGLIGAVRPITIIRNEDSCINCGKCNKACPMHIDIMGNKEVRSLQCINCLECLIACPVEKTLKIGVTTLGMKRQKLTRVIVSFIMIAGISFILFNIIDTVKGDLRNESVEVETQTDVATITEEEILVEDTDLIDSLQSEEAAETEEVAEAAEITEIIDEINANDSNTYIDGTYTGIGIGFRGEMTVQVTISEGIITNIEVTKNVDDRKWFNRAYSTIVSRILEKQSVDIDTVSGATYSSMGIIDGVKDALKNAVN